MEKRDSGFYQVAYYKGQQRITGRFDIVVGSGSKGQTYITRYKNELYQLPVSYFTAAHKWANSPLISHQSDSVQQIHHIPLPGMSQYFCQSDFKTGPDPESFDPKIIFGVDCEKCHGPAARHVEFQTQNPKEKTGKIYPESGTFSRQQNLDLCGLCHGGRLPENKTFF